MATQPEELEHLALDFVLGLLNDAERDRAEALLDQPGFACLVASVREWLGMLVQSAPEVPPHPGLLGAIKARIAVHTAADASRPFAADPAGWRAVAPGVMLKPLPSDHQAGKLCMLVRLASGATLPVRRHATCKAFVVLDGVVETAGRRLSVGDYLANKADQGHEPMVAADGALLFVSRTRPETSS